MRKKRRQIDMPPSYVIEHLDEAIEKKWCRVYYQPIVRTITGRLCAMEALARWDDPTWGFLTPPFFIGILEQHNLIHKLDAFLVEEVCRNQARVRKAGQPAVAVSLNLSRLDFIQDDFDIFTIVENAVRKYNVPRDLLHLEIVENVLTNRNKRIGETLNRFREAGYEIWMDDFGSGYSSLKFLKDQRFDLLKMDMAFLKSDTKRARDIIISIISMDKRIGNRTLAEGVETQEQFDFLREVGCEKIQGYYLGKPRPYDETIENCRKKGIEIELSCWKAYYDAIMDVDFLTGRPLLLVEYRDHGYHILFANHKCDEVLWPELEDGRSVWEKRLNVLKQPAIRYLQRGLRRVMLSGEAEELAYPLNGNFVMMNCHRVISYNGHCLISIDCHLHKIDHEGPVFKPAYFLRNLFYLYDSLAAVNLTKREVVVLTQPRLKSGLHKYSLDEALQNYQEQMIYSADRRRFAEFLDLNTLKERVDGSPLSSIAEAFRSKGPDGTLVWKTHRISRITSTKQDIFFYVIRVSDAQDVARYEKDLTGSQYTLTEQSGEAEAKEETSVMSIRRLWDNFIMSFPLPVFWKDRERRFLGVNQKFLDFYDFDSVEKVAAHTDEDMNWHVQPNSFKNDELDVIEKGVALHDVPGKCIARGRQYDILASKWPLYDEEGSIRGLMGYFLPTDVFIRNEEKSQKLLFTDGVTGLANIKGILSLLAQYMDEYRFKKRAFAAIFLRVRAIARLERRYGETAVAELLACIAEEMKRVLEQTGTAGRFAEDQFLIFYQYHAEEDVEKLNTALRQAIEGIHHFGQRSCTLFVETRTVYPEDSASFHRDILDAVLGGKHRH
ncbi:EAL domain-containing protein [Mitsuokella sp. WILCCON 0060]|uniref:EAL domain-containing protein n=1 Tax=Mitsuokella sp. WILCCON 0060 TaxID=3345341 RepID=UPI003F4BFB7D